MIKISHYLTPQLQCLLVQRGEASNCPDLVTCVFPKHARAAPKYFYSAQPLRAKYPFDLEGNFTKPKNKVSSDSLVIKQRVILPLFLTSHQMRTSLPQEFDEHNYWTKLSNVFSQKDPTSTNRPFWKISHQLMLLFPI